MLSRPQCEETHNAQRLSTSAHPDPDLHERFGMVSNERVPSRHLRLWANPSSQNPAQNKSQDADDDKR
jgi:hypothetical protein